MARPVATLAMAPRMVTQPGLRLLSYLALLPATAVELDAAVARAVAENPLLERRPWHSCRTCGLATVAERCPACATPAWDAEPVAAEDWRADLLRDAAAELPRRLHRLAAVVVAALDDHGLLRPAPVDETEDVREVVAALRLVGPPGIAATSAVDCLRVQAHALSTAGRAPFLLVQVVDGWLPAVAEGRYDEIAAALGSSEQEVAEVVALLRERLRPFVCLPSDAARSAPTDVVFTRSSAIDGRLTAHVAEPAAVGLRRVDDLPAAPEARAWLAPHRDAADRLLAAIAARSRMLQRVADELADRQPGFIEGGAAAHVPLRRREVATALSVHPSTVGRAVSGKLARCPDGRVVELSAFFGVVTSTRSRVEAALGADPTATDAVIAAALARSGPPIARRTVAKYRAMGTNAPSPNR